jgi:GAF domain-containing protein
VSLLCARLRQVVPHDCVAIYVLQADRLKAAYVQGENSRSFSSLEIPLGQGLSGWVLENNKPIVNGNPGVEPGYLNDTTKFTTLRSALAIPLRPPGGMRAVLALYALEREAFSKAQLEILLALEPKLAMEVASALRYQQGSSMVESLAGLANANAEPRHRNESSELAATKSLGPCRQTGHGSAQSG